MLYMRVINLFYETIPETVGGFGDFTESDFCSPAVCKNINLKQFIPNRFAISNIICTFVAIRTDIKV